MIDVVIQRLAKNAYEEEIFKEWEKAGEDIAGLLYFLQADQVPALKKKINELDSEERMSVFESLVNLYPMSRNIILEIIRYAKAEPGDFLEFYDQDRLLLEEIKKDVSEIDGIYYDPDRKTKEYLQQLEEISEEIVKNQGVLEKLKSVKLDCADKQEELEQLNKAIAAENVNEKKIEKEIAEKRAELRRKEEENKKKEEELKKLSEELEKVMEDFNKKKPDASKKVQDALTSLEQVIKEI